MQPVAPPSPDYVPGPEHPPSPDYVPSPEHPPSPVKIPYIPEPEYPEYLAPSDDDVPLKDQPLHADASPTTASPGYVADSDPNEDPKEDPEDDHAVYPANGGDGNDEPSDDDDDDDDDTNDEDDEPFEDEEDNEEEEEHLALADSSAIPFPTDIGAPLGYKASRIRIRALLPSTSHMTDILKADVSPQKRACLTTTPAPGFEVEESSTAGAARQPGPTESDLRRYKVELAGYGITDTWDKIVDTLIEIALTTLEGVDQRMIKLDTTIRQRTDEFKIRFEEAQDDRALLRARVNTLFRDRPDHHRTAMLLDRKAMYARKAWTGSKDRSTQLTTTLGRIKILEARDLEPHEGLAEAGSGCVTAALAERDADKSRNGDNSNDLGTGGRRQVTTQQECTYTYFLKCQPMNFQGTEGVVAKVERYIGSLPNMIHGSVKASKPQLMQEAIEFATEMMETRCSLMLNVKLSIRGNLMILQKGTNINISHLKGIMWHGLTLLGQEIRSLMEEPNLYVPSEIITTMGPVHQRAPTGHYKSDCPKLKNGNQGNRDGNKNDVARAYAVGTAETNPNSNVVTGTFLLNNRYASILFDTGADRSFISTAFRSLMDIIPTMLDHGYDVKLADGRIIWVNTLIRERVEVYYECMESFKSLLCLWIRSRSIDAIWLEKVVTPLIEPAIKGFTATSAVLKPEHLKVDKARYE
nr:reverse transcriptase domain-containing protein [Tanacetum cinerariifolium]